MKQKQNYLAVAQNAEYMNDQLAAYDSKMIMYFNSLAADTFPTYPNDHDTTIITYHPYLYKVRKTEFMGQLRTQFIYIKPVPTVALTRFAVPEYFLDTWYLLHDFKKYVSDLLKVFIQNANNIVLFEMVAQQVEEQNVTFACGPVPKGTLRRTKIPPYYRIITFHNLTENCIAGNAVARLKDCLEIMEEV